MFRRLCFFIFFSCTISQCLSSPMEGQSDRAAAKTNGAAAIQAHSLAVQIMSGEATKTDGTKATQREDKSICHLATDTVLPVNIARRIERDIKRSWFPPAGLETEAVTVYFELDEHGQVSAVRIEKSSGHELADRAAIEAVKNAAPLDSCQIGRVGISFTFDQDLFQMNSKNFYRWW